MQNNKLNELLNAIKAEVNNNNSPSKAVCPHCGRTLLLQPGKEPRGNAAPTRRAVARPRRKSAPNLRALASEFARRHFNGRIPESYAAVTKALGPMRGKNMGQIREAKINWYKTQLAK